ncbi:carboxylesterase [Aspergillus ustus]|uniref:Carboxylesterase n=1 Tax=Aspergillus ustus TaxID=40382 RepID=A0A0C1EFM6_ASPUT|nr:carboxylesterase [Aspergillus ustus]
MAKYADSWLQLEAAAGGRAVFQGTVSEIRAQFAGLFTAVSQWYPPASDAVHVTDGAINDVPYRVYTPSPSNATGARPIGVFMHGGGYIMGDLETEDLLCRTFSEQSNTIIVSVDYRLAPEHKSSAQLRDTMTVLAWVHGNASSLGANGSQLYTMGTSAGATLALLATREIVSGRSTVPAGSLRGVVAVSPITVHPDNVPMKFQAGYNSYTEFATGAPAITGDTMLEFFLHAGQAPDDVNAFLLLDQESLRRFPPVYISTAECDVLRDDGRVLVAALNEVGVSVREDILRGIPHAFWFFNTLPEWSLFAKNTVAGIRWVIDGKDSL